MHDNPSGVYEISGGASDRTCGASHATEGIHDFTIAHMVELVARGICCGRHANDMSGGARGVVTGSFGWISDIHWRTDATYEMTGVAHGKLMCAYYKLGGALVRTGCA